MYTYYYYYFFNHTYYYYYFFNLAHFSSTWKQERKNCIGGKKKRFVLTFINYGRLLTKREKEIVWIYFFR